MLDETSILTATMADDIRHTLENATDSIGSAGAPIYLDLLDDTAIGSPIGELIDVLEYFGMLDDDGDFIPVDYTPQY